MGACGTKQQLTPEEEKALKDERARSKALEQDLNRDNQLDRQINKLLLLGAGESGKSTLFKQMITIYGQGYPEKERRTFKPIIHNNIISSMKALIEQSDHLAKTHNLATTVDRSLEGAKHHIMELKQDEEINSDLARELSALWHDPGIKLTYENRARFQLTDSAAYFFDQVEQVAHPQYVPSEQDVLRSRVRTTGIVENEFKIEGNLFKMFDVGGQRNERKKWIHCFSEVTAVLFVAALSEYDMVLFEDENTNRMDEALNLFDEICNSRWFKKTSMILMLNKRDLFAEKIKHVPLTVWDPDYPDANEFEPASQYIQAAFESKNKEHATKKIYTHITCATDTNNMRVVFNAVKDIIIRKSLEESSLLG
jgi:guanine nucleotide-binding protein G(i) subunit alpha